MSLFDGKFCQEDADNEQIARLEQDNASLLILVEEQRRALQGVINWHKFDSEPTVNHEHIQAKADAHAETIIAVQKALALTLSEVELTTTVHVLMINDQVMGVVDSEQKKIPYEAKIRDKELQKANQVYGRINTEIIERAMNRLCFHWNPVPFNDI